MNATLRALQEKKASLLFAEVSAERILIWKRFRWRNILTIDTGCKFQLQEYKFNYSVLKWTDSEFSKDSGFLDCS